MKSKSFNKFNKKAFISFFSIVLVIQKLRNPELIWEWVS